MRYRACDLVYDDETHRTHRPDGVEVPHVTAIIKAVGVGTDFSELSAISQRLRASIDRARMIGQAVHADTHAYDDNDLDVASVHPDVLPFVEAWATVRGELQLEPLRRERRLYHDIWNYTGITDGLFAQRGTLKVILVDIKTGDPEASATHLQTGAYEGACAREFPDLRIDERWAVWLRPGLRVPYRIFNYTARADAHQDYDRFCACVTVFNEQPERRRRVA